MVPKLQFLIKKILIFFSAENFLDWTRIGIQPKMLDPDPDQMNTDSKH